jgi:hypothetical protein
MKFLFSNSVQDVTIRKGEDCLYALSAVHEGEQCACTKTFDVVATYVKSSEWLALARWDPARSMVSLRCSLSF